MSKYIIMHGSQWHETFDNFEEADNYYWELVDEDGDWFDLQLCKVMERHEAPERESKPLTNGRHWNIDTSKVEIKKLDTKEFLNPVYSQWFNKGKY